MLKPDASEGGSDDASEGEPNGDEEVVIRDEEEGKLMQFEDNLMPNQVPVGVNNEEKGEVSDDALVIDSGVEIPRTLTTGARAPILQLESQLQLPDSSEMSGNNASE